MDFKWQIMGQNQDFFVSSVHQKFRKISSQEYAISTKFLSMIIIPFLIGLSTTLGKKQRRYFCNTKQWARESGSRIIAYLILLKSQPKQTQDQQKQEIEAFFKDLKDKVNAEIDQAKDVVLDIFSASLVPLELRKQQDLKTQKTPQQPKPKEQQQQGSQTVNQEILPPSMPNLKQLYDEAYDLTKLKAAIKENYKGDINQLNAKVTDFLNDQSRKEKIKQIKAMQDILVKEQLGCFLTQNQEEKKNYLTDLLTQIDGWQVVQGGIHAQIFIIEMLRKYFVEMGNFQIRLIEEYCCLGARLAVQRSWRPAINYLFEYCIQCWHAWVHLDDGGI